MKRYLLLLTIIIFLGGCTKPSIEPTNNELDNVEEPAVAVDQTLSIEEQEVVLKDYFKLLESKASSEQLISFIDEIIHKMDKNYVDEIILTLEESLTVSNPSMEEISSVLMKYYDYSSDEVKSYIEILNSEGQMVFTDGEMIKIDLNELLVRAITSEKHLKNFPKGRTKNKVYDLSIAYIEGAIIGTGNQYIYAEGGSTNIRKEVIETYNEAINNNKDSSVAGILLDYIEVLALDNNDMNGGNVLEFYNNLNNIIKQKIKL